MLGRPSSLMLATFLALLVLLTLAGDVQAHRLLVRCKVLPGKQVQVEARYQTIPRSTPASEAFVEVFDAEGRRLRKGETNADGLFNFSYTKEEPLQVEVYQEGHFAKTAVFSDRPARTDEGSDEDWRDAVKNVLIGAAFLLSLTALWISWRNARQLRRLHKPG